ncbi:MAG: tellurite-resistance/dicarboxylate transporter [Candidatus Lokiarchaeota archaeon]|nr:tellurite-resistance/dicarboxylate transporter [Candidatus Harpocratesius repetitus]
MFKYIGEKRNFIRNFTPSWFASVMGTGILALTTLFYAEFIPWFAYIAQFLFYFNVFLFCFLLIPWTLRLLFFPKEAKADLMHPITSNFYPTIAVGLLVLSADVIVIGKNIQIGTILWVIASIFTIFFSIEILYVMFVGKHVKVQHISPAWFIPPVGLIVIPIPGSLLLPHFSGLFLDLIVFINIMSWGAGFFLYLAILAITMYRFILHEPLPNVLYPTVWINLGPIGAGTTALINLANNCCLINTSDTLELFGFFLWGFGIWWIIMALALMMHYIKKVKIPYAMSWWAFTFPLGAYVSATHSISMVFSYSLIDYIGFALYWLLLAFWIITFLYTIINSFNGKIFAPVESSKKNVE